MFDVHGLIDAKRDDVSPSPKVYAKDFAPIDKLADAVESFKPNGLIGVITTPGLFMRTSSRSSLPIPTDSPRRVRSIR